MEAIMAKIEIDTFYPYAPELVWDALTDSAALSQWLMENDFRPVTGHKFQFRAKPQPGWNGIVDCQVLTVDPHRELSYSWESDGKNTTVKWRLESASGGTRLFLEHTGFQGMGGFLLSKLILGPGWKKMMRKYIPVVLDHVSKNGMRFQPGVRLVDAKCHAGPVITA
jgi:uncharacterized protein YndB with AHSA1/START domain